MFYLLAGFILYLFCNIFRALRFHILLNREINLIPLFNLVCTYNMLNNLMPMRAGDLSYIYMLKKLHNKSVITGASTLIVSRLFDFVAISSLFIAAAWLAGDRLSGIKNVALMLSLFMFFCLLLLSILFYGGGRALDLINHLLHRMDSGKNAPGKYSGHATYLLSKLRETVLAMERMSNNKTTAFALLISFLIWSTNFSVVYLVIRGMHFDIPFPIIVMGSTFTVLSTILPIYGIAGLRTSQGLWTIVFLPLGIPLD